MTLIELMITVSIIAAVASGTAIFALKKYREAQVKTAGTNARVIRQAVQHFQVGRAGCPDVETLVDLDILDKASDLRDPWHGRFTITCPDGDVMVASRGPDGAEWTEDDIFIPDLSELVDPFAQGTITGPGWSVSEEDLPKGLTLEEWLADAKEQQEPSDTEPTDDSLTPPSEPQDSEN